MDKRKVLYQIGHYGFLINCFFHKIIYHKDDTAIFIVDEVLMGNLSVEFLKNYKNNFNRLGTILLYNDKDLIYSFSTIEDMEKGIDTYFDKFLSKNKINLNDFDEIYSIFDTFNAFGVYLTRQNIPFNMMETIKEQCQNHNRYSANNLSTPYGATIFKYLALSFDNPCVKKLYCNKNAVITDKPYEENINAVEMIKKISKEDIDYIINCYEINYDVNKQYACYMPNSHWISDVYFKLPHIYYMLLNGLVLDLYQDKALNLLIKPHPSTDFPDSTWKEYFNNCDIIPGYFPSLLLSYIDNLHIVKTISTGTTGVDSSKDSAVSVPFNTLFYYKNLYKLYFSILLVKYLQRNKIYHFGLFEDVINSFVHRFLDKTIDPKFFDFQNKKNEIVLIDDINCNNVNRKEKLINCLKNCDEDSIFIFLNSKNDFCFVNGDYDISNNIIQISLFKEKINTNSLENEEKENIFIYCKNKEIQNIIKSFNSEQIFINVGIKVKAQYCTINDNLILRNMNLSIEDYNIKLASSSIQNYYLLNKSYITFLIDYTINEKNDYYFYRIYKEFLIDVKNSFIRPLESYNFRGIDTRILKGNIFTIIRNVPKEESKNIEFALLNADLKTKVVFWDLDYKNIISFENMQLLDYIVPITIHKEKLREDTLSDTNDETIYFFCKDENIRNKIKNFKFEKELKHTGIKMYCNVAQDIQNALIVQNMKIDILTHKIQNNNS